MNKKLVIVTGGTKGIGRAIVDLFAKEGYSIATCARNEQDLDVLKSELEEKYETKIHTCPADLSEKRGVNDFLEFVRMIGKPLEVLVNNTGVFNPGSIETEEDGALENMINTNLYSAYHLTRGLLPDLKKSEKGHIFNMCSIASVIAYPNGGSYSISKFALYGFSKVLREELKEEGIRVTSVLPGATLTPSWDGVDLPEDRLMKASDIAQMIWSTYQLSSTTVVEDIVLRPQLGDL